MVMFGFWILEVDGVFYLLLSLVEIFYNEFCKEELLEVLVGVGIDKVLLVLLVVIFVLLFDIMVFDFRNEILEFFVILLVRS